MTTTSATDPSARTRYLDVWPLGPPTDDIVPHPSGREGHACMRAVALLGDWYGAERGTRAHGAQDIFAPRGTAILSPIDGFVALSHYTTSGGWTVTIRGARAQVVLSHMAEAPYVQQGDTVRAGEQVGVVGNTGARASRTCPHLHIGVRRMPGRVLVNPYPDLLALAPPSARLPTRPAQRERRTAPPRPVEAPTPAARPSGSGGLGLVLVGIGGLGLAALAARKVAHVRR